jgi:hypothetical protein
MARPKRGEEKHATSQIGVRVSEELRGEIEASAGANGMTLTDELRELIVEGLKVRSRGQSPSKRTPKPARRAKGAALRS